MQYAFKTGQFGLVGSSMAYLFCFGLVRQGLANFASITGAAITPLYAYIRGLQDISIQICCRKRQWIHWISTLKN